MEDVKTVNTSSSNNLDPLLSKQKEDVAKMRTSLLCCSDDPFTATQAMRNITVLRVYHQISRIIRYLEMMDKIESKLYESLNLQLDSMDPNSPMTWMSLLNVQEKLQKNLIESQKLLQPYLESQSFSLEEMMDYGTAVPTPGEFSVMPKESRDKLRNSAQQVLALLGPVDEGDVNAG